MTGRLRGMTAEVHLAGDARSAVIRTLRPEDEFEIQHRVGSAEDRWVKIRISDGLEGFIPDDPSFPKTPAVEAASPLAMPFSARPGVRDMAIGSALFAFGGLVLLWMRTTPYASGVGIGKEALALGYGGYRFIKGFMTFMEAR